MNFYIGQVTEVRMILINQNVGSPMHMSPDSVWDPFRQMLTNRPLNLQMLKRFNRCVSK